MRITESAKKRLDEVLGSGEFLEIGLRGGGCGGATIEMNKVSLTNTIESNLIVTSDVIFADLTSQQYLIAGTLDFSDDLLSATFIFKPPLGLESCGCGASVKL